VGAVEAQTGITNLIEEMRWGSPGLLIFHKHRGSHNMGEILTAREVAALLRISTRQVYQLAKESENPIPAVRIRTSVRFRRVDVDGWLAKLAGKAA
jgi:excisionase family DNA binding protein